MFPFISPHIYGILFSDKNLTFVRLAVVNFALIIMFSISLCCKLSSFHRQVISFLFLFFLILCASHTSNEYYN